MEKNIFPIDEGPPPWARIWTFPPELDTKLVVIDDEKILIGSCPGLIMEHKRKAIEQGKQVHELIPAYSRESEKTIPLEELRDVRMWKRLTRFSSTIGLLKIRSRGARARLMTKDEAICRQIFRELRRRLGDRCKLKISREGYLVNLWIPILLWISLIILTFLNQFGEFIGFTLEHLAGYWLPGLLIDLYLEVVEKMPPVYRPVALIVLTLGIAFWIVHWLRNPLFRISLKRKRATR